MGFKQITPQSEVNKYLDNEIQKRVRQTIETLAFVGNECVKIARDTSKSKTFTDQTGNLRSSIGYAIVIDGRVLNTSDFENVEGKKKRGGKGKPNGLNFVNELAQKHSKGIVLLVVAGMNYASYVETTRDVLKSAEINAKVLLSRLLKELGIR